MFAGLLNAGRLFLIKGCCMENQIFLSAGIDVGTTTTHLIISRIGIAVRGGFGTVSHAVITKKEIIYQSKIYFTPLDDNGNINGAKVAEIIKKEYAARALKRRILIPAPLL